MVDVADGAKRIAIRARREGAEMLIEVSDQGCGLTDPAAVFESFYTTKASGMGMGLAISRSIVEAHGGRLWASANQGIGTTFSFTLPLPL
jgi:signal transduction histidine kinase